MTEKVNAVDTAHRSFLEVKDNGEICVGPQSSDLRTPQGDKEDWKGGGPTPLSQNVADIAELYKDCSNFMGISGCMETIPKQTGE